MKIRKSHNPNPNPRVVCRCRRRHHCSKAIVAGGSATAGSVADGSTPPRLPSTTRTRCSRCRHLPLVDPPWPDQQPTDPLLCDLWLPGSKRMMGRERGETVGSKWSEAEPAAAQARCSHRCLRCWIWTSGRRARCHSQPCCSRLWPLPPTSAAPKPAAAGPSSSPSLSPAGVAPRSSCCRSRPLPSPPPLSCMDEEEMRELSRG